MFLYLPRTQVREGERAWYTLHAHASDRHGSTSAELLSVANIRVSKLFLGELASTCVATCTYQDLSPPPLSKGLGMSTRLVLTLICVASFVLRECCLRMLILKKTY